MPKAKRGRVIFYDHIPDDVFKLILKKQLEVKEQTLRGQVSLSEAITRLIRSGAKVNS